MKKLNNWLHTLILAATLIEKLVVLSHMLPLT